MEYHDWYPFERWQSAKGSLLIKTVIQSHGLFIPLFFAVKNFQFSFLFLNNSLYLCKRTIIAHDQYSTLNDVLAQRQDTRAG